MNARPRPLALLAAALLLSCGDGTDAAGPPELRRLLALGPDHQEVDLLAPPATGLAPISPLSEFKAVFSELLDGSKIEELAGGKVTGKTDVVQLAWADAPAGAPAITATTIYNSGGALGIKMPGPSILIRPAPGLPAGAKIQIRLAREKITGKKGAPFQGADTHEVQTAPFEVTANLKPGEVVSPGFMVKLSFTNLPAATAKEHVKVTEGGRPVPLDVQPDTKDPTTLVVSAAGGAWAPRAYTLTVEAQAADHFGVKLARGLTLDFGVAEPGSDAGPIVRDAGVAMEAGAVDAPAVDAALAADAAAAPDAAAAADAAAAPDAAADAAAGGPADAGTGGAADGAADAAGGVDAEVDATSGG